MFKFPEGDSVSKENNACVGLATTTISSTLMIPAPEPYNLKPILFQNPKFENFLLKTPL